MSEALLQKERLYLANLLEAIQRCAWFLSQSENKLAWPLAAEYLAQHKKDVALFETMAAINEHIAKLQDSLAAAMRHSALLMSGMLYHTARRLLKMCDETLGVQPISGDFNQEFNTILERQ